MTEIGAAAGCRLDDPPAIHKLPYRIEIVREAA